MNDKDLVLAVYHNNETGEGIIDAPKVPADNYDFGLFLGKVIYVLTGGKIRESERVVEGIEAGLSDPPADIIDLLDN